MKRGPMRGPARSISLRAVAPNAVTVLALCFGLTGIRFAISEEWERAIAAILVAGMLDGLDGRIARMLRGESRFGAELDSLSDAIAFGVSPALILYLWSLQSLPQIGWICALAHAVFCALRLARFNSNIDVADQPHKSAGFLTGIPAPAGAGLAMLPLYLWIITGEPFFREPLVVAPWLGLVAFLMISSIATYSWGSLKLRSTVRFEAIAVVAVLGGALLSAPWHTLTALCVAYLATLPFSIRSYARARRLRAAEGARAPVPAER